MNCIINKAVYNYYVQQNGRVSKKQNKFQILKSLERDSHPTQRQLSNDLGVSLGKVNYCLKSLICNIVHYNICSMIKRMNQDNLA